VTGNSVLPDVLGPDLRVVFCGTAVGRRSARLQAYYAAPGNQFWPVLRRVGLTQRQLAPSEFLDVLVYRIGLSDLVKVVSGTDAEIQMTDSDCHGFKAKIEQFAPKVVAFNGKRAAETFLGRTVTYGRQSEVIGDTMLFVLPSTSGAARRFWDETYWHELASLVRGLEM
jgi:TDG/mug DNA glycosylase family protein